MARTGIQTYLRPETLEEALAALGEGAVAISGGTDVIRHTPAGTTTLVDLGSLPLRYIRREDGFAVGATTTFTEMLEHPGLAAHLDGVIAATLRGVGSPLLRNVATIGGHLARRRFSDVIPLLLALDAGVTIYDGAELTLPLARFYAEGVDHTRMLITEVHIPAAGGDTTAAFLKFTRTAFDFALLNCAVAVRLDAERRVTHCRIVIGETPALGASVLEAEDALGGHPLDDQAIAGAAEIAAAVIPAGSDQRASADYRRALCRAAVSRCLGEARRRLEGGRR